jgi:MFS transporter, DHA1 family, tetracycline resistance protein
MNDKKIHVVLWALFLVLFIDGLGQGLLYPILTRTLIDVHSTALIHFGSVHTRNVLYAIVIAVFFFGWFFGGTFLSDFSDRIGRKKALLICVAGSAVGYLLCALSFVFHSIFFLIIGRAIDGFTAGDQPIAQATIMDLCPTEKKHIYVGLVLLAFTAGLVSGPIVGGYLSSGHFIIQLNNMSPMYLGMWLSILAFISLSIFFVDTAAVRRDMKVSIFRVFEIFKEAFYHRSVRFLLIAFFFMQLGWTMYYLYASVFLARSFNFSAQQVAIYTALIGVGLFFGLAVLPRLFGRMKQKKWLVICGYFGIALTIFIAAMTKNPQILWILVVPGPALFALAYSNIIPIFSAQVLEDRQGWVMGLTGAAIALAAGIAPLLAGWVNMLGANAPMLLASGLSVFGCILMSFFPKAKC